MTDSLFSLDTLLNVSAFGFIALLVWLYFKDFDASED